MVRKCKHCGKTIRSNSKKAIYLFLQETPRGVQEQWVCDKNCLRGYNDGEDSERA